VPGHQLTVLGRHQVDIDPIDPLPEGQLVGGEGAFGPVTGRAPVSHHDDTRVAGTVCLIEGRGPGTGLAMPGTAPSRASPATARTVRFFRMIDDLRIGERRTLLRTNHRKNHKTEETPE
jgi:hypothetical protein